MYIRTREEALAAIGGILAIPDLRCRRFEATLRLLQCLQPVPRALILDAQTFLVDGGLAELRDRRRDLLARELPLMAMEEGGLAGLEEIACGLDALRFAAFVRDLFPGLRTERWRIARAALAEEATVRELALDVFRAAGHPGDLRRTQGILWALTLRHNPAWNHRSAQIREICKQGLRTFPQPPDPDRFPLEAELLFELTALSDVRVRELLTWATADPSEAAREVHHLEELALEIRNLPPFPPESPGPGSAHAVA